MPAQQRLIESGFYFDEIKGKYFKAVPEHHPQSAKHSAGNVLRKKQKLNVQNAQAFARLRSIQQPPALQQPLVGSSGLYREAGSRFDPKSHAFAWASGLEPYSWLGRTLVGSQLGDIEHFVYDDATGTLILDSGFIALKPSFNSTGAIYGDLNQWYPRGVSSMSISSSRALLVIKSAEAARKSGMHLRRLSDPQHFLQGLGLPRPRTSNQVLPISEMPFLDCSGSNMQWRSSFLELYASSPSPEAGSTMFAVASSRGLLCVAEKQGSEEIHIDKFYETQNFTSDQSCRTVDWLDHKTIIFGTRHGMVGLWDRRVNSAVERITFGPRVVHSRCLDRNRILVAGIKNRLMSYDLRFTHTHQSKPYTIYEGYDNSGHIALGLDISPDRFTIAAANGIVGVKLFDVADGHQIKLPEGLQEWPTAYGPSRCLRFVDGLQSVHVDDNKIDDRIDRIKGPDVGLRLLVAQGNDVVSWSW